MISKRCTRLLTKNSPGILCAAAHANASSAMYEGLDSRNSRGHFPSEKHDSLERDKFAFSRFLYFRNNFPLKV